MINILLFGPPGAGKGTQANILKDKYQLIHISTGDVFRFNINNETELGILVKKYIDQGELVPDKLTIDILKAEIEKNVGAKGFIFDGFPRTTSQAVALDACLSEKGYKVDGMISLEVPENLLLKRILNRVKISGRSDDQSETKIKNRFNHYNTKTAVLKEYYQRKNCYYCVDGVGTIKEITERLDTIFKKLSE